LSKVLVILGVEQVADQIADLSHSKTTAVAGAILLDSLHPHVLRDARPFARAPVATAFGRASGFLTTKSWTVGSVVAGLALFAVQRLLAHRTA
uniref:Cobalamin biosynthesis protein n=1 Tax=Soboliphyme baturini TaxID=241478 RepID=A0A183J4W2_9BILA